MGHNSDSDVMGTRVGGMLLTQVRSPPLWLTLKGAPNLKLGSPDAGRNLAKNAKNQKTSFLRPSKARPWFAKRSPDDPSFAHRPGAQV